MLLHDNKDILDIFYVIMYIKLSEWKIDGHDDMSIKQKVGRKNCIQNILTKPNSGRFLACGNCCIIFLFVGFLEVEETGVRVRLDDSGAVDELDWLVEVEATGVRVRLDVSGAVDKLDCARDRLADFICERRLTGEGGIMSSSESWSEIVIGVDCGAGEYMIREGVASNLSATPLSFVSVFFSRAVDL